MNTRMSVFLLFAVCCAAVQFAAAQEKDPCKDPIIPGRITFYCDAISFTYAYNITSNECVEIMNTGCTFGSDNDFRTKAICEEKCVH